jgi:hypothetical protein
VNLLLAWLRILTGAAADGYAEAVRAGEEIRANLGHQLLQALYGGQAGAESTAHLARAIDFLIPAETFRLSVVRQTRGQQ